MNDIQRDAKRWIRHVEVLLRSWDPIGVIPDLEADRLLANEYNDYAPHIVGLLHRGATESELAAHLRHCRTQAMGLPPDDAADLSTAREILAWWREETHTERGAV